MTIEERFEKLEKQNRKLKKWMAGIGAIAVMALVGGTALSVRAYTAAIDPVTITTQSIFLKDSAGRTRVALSGGSGVIHGFDVNGKSRVTVDANGYIYVTDTNGIIRARLFPDGTVGTFDGNGKVRAQMSSIGRVYVYDSNGIARVFLNASDNKIYFTNASGGTVAAHP